MEGLKEESAEGRRVEHHAFVEIETCVIFRAHKCHLDIGIFPYRV